MGDLAKLLQSRCPILHNLSLISQFMKPNHPTQDKIVFVIINVYLYVRGGRLLQTSTVIGQEVQLSISCPIRMLHLTNNNALIGFNYTMFTNRPPLVYVKQNT